jgi:hypothetical protein
VTELLIDDSVYGESDGSLPERPLDKGALDEMLERLFSKQREKGGPGSGHHGHAGRPGKRGGSTPGTTHQEVLPGFERPPPVLDPYSGMTEREAAEIRTFEENVLAVRRQKESGWVVGPYPPHHPTSRFLPGEETSMRLPFGQYTDAVLTHYHPATEITKVLYDEETGEESFVIGSDPDGRNWTQPFSPSDMRAAEVKNFKEIRAVGHLPDGRHVIYRAIRPAGSNVWPEVKKYIDENYDAHNDAYGERVHTEFGPHYNFSERIEMSRLSADHLHEFWTSAAEDLGFTYQRIVQ